MSPIFQIVSGGGWKLTRIQRVKLKAWITLFTAIGLGCVSIVGAESICFYACIAGGLALFMSVVLFIRERPREFEFSSGRAGHDLRKLYGACTSTKSATDRQKAKPRAASEGGPATLVGNSGARACRHRFAESSPTPTTL